MAQRNFFVWESEVNSRPGHLERILPLCLPRHYRNLEVICDEGVMSGICVLSTIAMKTLSKTSSKKFQFLLLSSHIKENYIYYS